jgi:hypothetical protein
MRVPMLLLLFLLLSLSLLYHRCCHHHRRCAIALVVDRHFALYCSSRRRCSCSESVLLAPSHIVVCSGTPRRWIEVVVVAGTLRAISLAIGLVLLMYSTSTPTAAITCIASLVHATIPFMTFAFTFTARKFLLHTLYSP